MRKVLKTLAKLGLALFILSAVFLGSTQNVLAGRAGCYAGIPSDVNGKHIQVYIRVTCDEKYKSKVGSLPIDPNKCYLVEFQGDNHAVSYAGETDCDSGIVPEIDPTRDIEKSYLETGLPISTVFADYAIIPVGAPPVALPEGAECYQGIVVDKAAQYSKVDCTPAYALGIGVSEIKPKKCYMGDESSIPPYHGEMDCDEAHQKAQGTEGNASGGPGGGSNGGGSNNGAGGTIVNNAPAPCVNNSPKFFGLPTWYEFLEVGPNCAVVLDLTGNPNQIWLIGLAIADILLTLSGLVAVLFVMYGGYQYITSQFSPEGVQHAKDTILNALIGLAIAIAASGIVNLIGNTIK